MHINPHQHLSAYKSALIDKGLSEFDAELAIKALPSAPVWSTTTIEYGFWDANREKLLALMATYQKNERVHGCIDIIAKAVANAACQLMEVVDSSDKSLLARRHRKLIAGKRLKRLRKQWAVPQLARRALNDDDGLAEITEHPMLAALSSTDNDQTFHSLLRLLVVNLIVFGVSFFKKERDPRGEVSSYLYLPAYNVTPDRGTDGRIEGWFYSSTYGEAIPKLPIAKDDMLIVRWPSLTDPHAGGDSPLQSALRQVDLFGKMLDWQDWTFGNRARMDGVFVPKVSDGTSISPEEASRQEKRINDKLRGPGNGRWIVSEFAGQYVPTSWAPTDLATLEVEDKVATAVMFALNVPEAFANNDGNRANLEGSLEQFARFCVAPVIALIESSFNAELKSEFETANAIWVFENVIPEDDNFALEEEKVKVQAWQIARQNGDVTANEYRTNVLGIDEDPELDEEDEAPPPPPAAVVAPANELPAAQRDGALGKSFDLIALNRLVSAGRIDRATAICVASFELSIPEQDAKRLICHSAKKKRQRRRRPDLPPLILPDPIDLEDALEQQMAQQKSHYLNQCDGLGKRLPVPQSPSVVDFAAKDTEIGAQLYGDARLAKLGLYLGRRSVCLEVGSPDLPAEKAGAFIANPDGTARLLLKADPTNQLVWHELGHYIQWSDIGSDAYLALPREFGNNVPEQFVFNLLDQPGRWSRLTPGYRLHMVDYITNTWGGIGR